MEVPLEFLAYMFDMDGTLVDSDAAVERSWSAWARANGFEPEEVIAVAHGSPAEATVRRLLPGLSAGEVAEQSAALLAREYEDLEGVVATAGALDLVAALDLAGLPWAVVTSADDKLARLIAEIEGTGETDQVSALQPRWQFHNNGLVGGQRW